MKKKLVYKIAVDGGMALLLLLLMARPLTSDSAHEWLGVGMMILWLAHHILNWNWHSHLFRGKYTPVRILQAVTTLALFLAMAGLIVSGVILSRAVFAFLPISGGIALARSLHVFSAFWGFVLMALHLGVHWQKIIGIVRKAIMPAVSKGAQAIGRSASIVIAGYGLYAFVKNQFLSYMFLTSSFVFFDFERPAVFFFTEYIATMGLFVFLAHYTLKGMQALAGRRK